MTSAVTKAYKALVTNKKTLTTKQIASQFGVSNPHDVIYRLRKTGLNIVTEETKTGVMKYRYVSKTSKK